jgi:TPR repeat protein
LITFADAPLIEAILAAALAVSLAAALAVILRPRPAEGREIGPADSPGPIVDTIPAVVRALQVIGVPPVELLKGVSIDVYDCALFDLGAILPPGLRPAYEKARDAIDSRRLDVVPLMAELMGPIVDGAGRGDPAMILLLAHIHLRGLGVPRDEDQAYRLFRLAAEAGDLVAASALGDLLMEGTGTLPDYDEAVVWMRRALPLGANRTRLSLWYARKIRPDLVSAAEAVEGVIFASARGDANARSLIDDGQADLDFTVADLRLAARYSGETVVWSLLARVLLFGPAGDRDETDGVAALRQAARGRDDQSARLLARLYREGARGLPKDAAEADKWASAAERFQRERSRGGPREDLSRYRPLGSPEGWMTWETSAGGAGQAAKSKKPKKPKKAKKPRRRG